MKRKKKGGFIIFNKEKTKILLVKQKYHDEYPKWGCPKGHREIDENLIDTAIRELFEETGLELDKRTIYKYINICNTCYYIFTLDFDFIPLVRDKREISEASFINLDRISDLNTNLELKKINEHINLLASI